ncbi:MAG: hypothetical protein JJE25_04010, partial [Bacteroidia bacterium]|nr:hypothetical protein [Bacteroidia bacterium]
YALALGRINEYASTKQKIANAKVIKTEAEAAIRFNPKHAGAYHILGRWHGTIAGFNAFEKLMINTMFGGVPEGGSYDRAIECFAKAAELEPDYMLHQYQLAESYHERENKNDDTYAKAWLRKAMLLPLKNDEDKNTLAKCKELLSKLK